MIQSKYNELYKKREYMRLSDAIKFLGMKPENLDILTTLSKLKLLDYECCQELKAQTITISKAPLFKVSDVK